TRRLDDVRNRVAARQGAAGPKEVRRRRAAAAGRLRGDEKTGVEAPTPGQDSLDGSPRAAGRALHRHGQAGRGEQVAGRAGAVSRRRPAAPREEMGEAIFVETAPP